MSEAVAVVGSRGWRDTGAVQAYVFELPSGVTVVSGGAPGVDRAAAEAARLRGDVPDIVRADWNAHGKIAGKMRNWPLVGRTAHVEAFWDGWSNGTAHAIAAAVAQGVPVNVRLPLGFKVPS